MNRIISLRCKNCGGKLYKINVAKKYKCDNCDSEFLIETNDLKIEDESVSKNNDFVIVAGVLKEYKGRSNMVEIPNDIAIIGKEAFKGMELIESISIPEGVVKIDDRAFFECKRLKYVSFPESLEYIGDFCFCGCGIEDAFLCDNVSNIGKGAFMNCMNLKKAVLPDNKNIKYEDTFKNCPELIDVKCNLINFCLSFRPSKYANKNGNIRPTLYDAFSGTKYIEELKNKQQNRKCIIMLWKHW